MAPFFYGIIVLNNAISFFHLFRSMGGHLCPPKNTLLHRFFVPSICLLCRQCTPLKTNWIQKTAYKSDKPLIFNNITISPFGDPSTMCRRSLYYHISHREQRQLRHTRTWFFVQGHTIAQINRANTLWIWRLPTRTDSSVLPRMFDYEHTAFAIKLRADAAKECFFNCDEFATIKKLSIYQVSIIE